MTGLLYGNFGWDRYWNIETGTKEDEKQPISPLHPKFPGNNRIYPVKGANMSPTSFMNKTIIGSNSKSTFKNLAQDPKSGNYIKKQLWWVYGGSVYENGQITSKPLRERRLFLSSEKAKTNSNNNSARAIRALEIFYDGIPLLIIDLVKTRHSDLEIRSNCHRIIKKLNKPIRISFSTLRI